VRKPVTSRVSAADHLAVVVDAIRVTVTVQWRGQFGDRILDALCKRMRLAQQHAHDYPEPERECFGSLLHVGFGIRRSVGGVVWMESPLRARLESAIRSRTRSPFYDPIIAVFPRSSVPSRSLPDPQDPAPRPRTRSEFFPADQVEFYNTPPQDCK